MPFLKFKKYGLLLSKPRNFLSDKQYILIISHMRSRSTLLGHILGSNTEICGHGELHLPYAKRLSLLKMRAALQSCENFESCNYFLDKVLHNKLDVDTALFKGKLKTLILVREPFGTVRSMFNMHQQLYGANNYWHLIDYYTDRINYIASFAYANKEKFLFVDSESLVNDTEKTLGSISHYLGLKTQLSAKYRQFSDTGVAGAGDPGKNITAGKIIKTADGVENYEISESDKNRLLTAYSLCKATLVESGIQLMALTWFVVLLAWACNYLESTTALI
jgi:hypothetical protein